MSPPPGGGDVTQLLLEGIPAAPEESRKQLFTAVYEDLRRLARRIMRNERAEHTLRPTALVHEAYMRLVDQDRVGWQDKAYFLGVAARAMRQILVDHAREKAADKRGGGLTRVTLDDVLADGSGPDCEIIDLHNCLEKLGQLDERMARVVELRTFAGMSSREAAHVLGVSKRTIDKDWSFAKLWLSRELKGGAT